MDRRTGRPTDRVTYRVACTRLKSLKGQILLDVSAFIGFKKVVGVAAVLVVAAAAAAAVAVMALAMLAKEAVAAVMVVIFIHDNISRALLGRAEPNGLGQ